MAWLDIGINHLGLQMLTTLGLTWTAVLASTLSIDQIYSHISHDQSLVIEQEHDPEVREKQRMFWYVIL